MRIVDETKPFNPDCWGFMLHICRVFFRLCPPSFVKQSYFSVYITSDRHKSRQRGQAVGHQQAKLTMRVKCLSKSCAWPVGLMAGASVRLFEKPRGWQVLFVMLNWWEPISALRRAGVCVSSPVVVIWPAKVKMSLTDRCIRVHSLLVSAREPDMPI